MTEQQKKTLGMAIASLVCGLMFLIPILGLLFSLPAIILGIIALVKINKNKETLKGSGMAITGIVLGGIGIFLIPVIALLAAIAIPNFLRAKISANEALAKSTLRTLSTATETYKASTGKYPTTSFDLTEATPPYLATDYCIEGSNGYNIDCTFDPNGYSFIATPEDETLKMPPLQIETKGVPNWEISQY